MHKVFQLYGLDQPGVDDTTRYRYLAMGGPLVNYLGALSGGSLKHKHQTAMRNAKVLDFIIRATLGARMDQRALSYRDITVGIYVGGKCLIEGAPMSTRTAEKAVRDLRDLDLLEWDQIPYGETNALKVNRYWVRFSTMVTIAAQEAGLGTCEQLGELAHRQLKRIKREVYDTYGPEGYPEGYPE